MQNILNNFKKVPLKYCELQFHWFWMVSYVPTPITLWITAYHLGNLKRHRPIFWQGADRQNLFISPPRQIFIFSSLRPYYSRPLSAYFMKKSFWQSYTDRTLIFSKLNFQDTPEDDDLDESKVSNQSDAYLVVEAEQIRVIEPVSRAILETIKLSTVRIVHLYLLNFFDDVIYFWKNSIMVTNRKIDFN